MRCSARSAAAIWNSPASTPRATCWMAATARRLRDFPLGPALGQCCGGHVTVLFEPMRPARLARGAVRRRPCRPRAGAIAGHVDCCASPGSIRGRTRFPPACPGNVATIVTARSRMRTWRLLPAGALRAGDDARPPDRFCHRRRGAGTRRFRRGRPDRLGYQARALRSPAGVARARRGGDRPADLPDRRARHRRQGSGGNCHLGCGTNPPVHAGRRKGATPGMAAAERTGARGDASAECRDCAAPCQSAKVRA